MKNSKFIHAGLILILLSACQTRKVQTPNASTATGTQTSAQTRALTTIQTRSNEAPNVNKLTIHDSSVEGGVDYVITPDRTDEKASAYQIAITSKDESGAVTQTQLSVTEKASEKLFRVIDSIFLGKVKISPAKTQSDDGKEVEAVASLIIGAVSGTDQTILNPVFEGEESEGLLEELAKLLQASQDAAAAQKPASSDVPTDQTNVEPRDESRADVKKVSIPACQSLNLAGTWQAYIAAQGQVITITSEIRQTGAANGLISYSGADTVNGARTERSYRYDSQSCVLEKTISQNQKVYLKVTVVNTIHQRVKLVPCTDQSCTRYDPYPHYTEVVVLNRVK